jgi:hypothetical protein
MVDACTRSSRTVDFSITELHTAFHSQVKLECHLVFPVFQRNINCYLSKALVLIFHLIIKYCSNHFINISQQFLDILKYVSTLDDDHIRLMIITSH